MISRAMNGTHFRSPLKEFESDKLSEAQEEYGENREFSCEVKTLTVYVDSTGRRKLKDGEYVDSEVQDTPPASNSIIKPSAQAKIIVEEKQKIIVYSDHEWMVKRDWDETTNYYFSTKEKALAWAVPYVTSASEGSDWEMQTDSDGLPSYEW